MANKKIGKLLAFTAIAGAAIAAGIAYFKHKSNSEFYDDDFDDLDDDFDDDEDFDFPLPAENEEKTIKREYVSLNLDKEAESPSENAAAENVQEEASPANEEETVKAAGAE
ncbi:hypothetical protein [Konateibacter massiliensis]|uniref:hypothetical protein n=1 Tax=Konateibacter massiliensis TaxID=2002841 RepID=UPI000C15AF86|nr:hypothetical protein [Konateibacter massiliensis]